MEILRGFDIDIKNSAVSLGKFDGIHRGHRLLLKEIKSRTDLIPTVFTFDVSAQDRINENVPVSRKLIYSQQEKEMLLEKLGVDRLVLFPFTEETRMMEPEEFIEKFLIQKMDAGYICVGEDYRFGRDRKGNVGTLKKYASKYGYDIKIFHKLKSSEDIISSTLIRETIENGEISRANELLGEPYFISGEVVHGKALGRTLDMPTANIIPDREKVLLRSGVYAAIVEIDGKSYKGVTNIGRKPTVGQHEGGVETCILNFNQDIYGRDIVVKFIEFIRPEKKFPGIEQLKEQMEHDKKQAAHILSSIKNL